MKIKNISAHFHLKRTVRVLQYIINKGIWAEFGEPTCISDDTKLINMISGHFVIVRRYIYGINDEKSHCIEVVFHGSLYSESCYYISVCKDSTTYCSCRYVEAPICNTLYKFLDVSFTRYMKGFKRIFEKTREELEFRKR